MKKKAMSVILILLLLVVTACGKKATDNTDKSSDKVSSEDKSIEVGYSNSRTYAVMINNHNITRPYHSGLQDAEVIYEMIVEGGITRMLAIFRDKLPERVGSVRSARHYYLDYAMEHDAIYVHWGKSPQAESDISKYSITHFDGLSGGKYFWKDTNLKIDTEHRGFLNLPLLKEAAINKKYNQTTNKDKVFSYSAKDIELENANDAKTIEIKYSGYMTVKYTYDANTKTYLRYANGKEHSDYVTKKQYNFKNILVYDVKNTSLDSSGRQNLDNVGSGTGYYFTNGEAIKINWKKTSREGRTIYTTESGENLILNNGNTFVQIYPVSGQLTFS